MVTIKTAGYLEELENQRRFLLIARDTVMNDMPALQITIFGWSEVKQGLVNALHNLKYDLLICMEREIGGHELAIELVNGRLPEAKEFVLLSEMARDELIAKLSKVVASA